jgi:hypothetical protein
LDTIELFISGFGDACCEDFPLFVQSLAILLLLRNVRFVASGFDVSLNNLYQMHYHARLILASPLRDSIMQVAVQKDLQRTVIYSADAH